MQKKKKKTVLSSRPRWVVENIFDMNDTVTRATSFPVHIARVFVTYAFHFDNDLFYSLCGKRSAFKTSVLFAKLFHFFLHALGKQQNTTKINTI